MNKINKIKESSILQHDTSDCGIACLASVIKYHGGDCGLEKLRNLSGTQKNGTSLLGLLQAANKCGLIAEGFEASPADIARQSETFILHVVIEENLEHFVLYYGTQDDKFIIWDPGKGLSLINEEELGRIWKSGKCLSVYPGPAFRTKNAQGISKKKWLISMLKQDKDMLMVCFILGIAISALGVVMALYTQKLIDKILPSGELRILYSSAFLVMLLLIARIILSSVRQMFLLLQGKLFNTRVVDDFFTAIMYLKKSFFDSRKAGDFVARLNDTMRIQKVIAEIASIYIIDILIIIITSGILFYYSTIAGLITVACLPLLFFLVNRQNQKIISSQHDVMSGYSASESNFIDSIKGILEIKSMNWQIPYSEKNKIIYSDFQSRIVSLGRIKIKLGLITGFASSLYLMLILVWSASKVIASDMTQGELMAVISLGSSLLPSALNIALISIPLSEVKVAVNRMFEFTQMETEKKAEGPQKKRFEINSIKLKNISFRFPGQKLLLKNINMSVQKGEIISVTGESGCGKSTLACIMMRFYEPESGSIMFDNELPVTSKGIELWRSRIALVPQEVHIFNGTILQNLLSEINEAGFNEMLATISEMGLLSFINSFPSGLMTLVGEEGINLSGGQKQLLAFIRALLIKPDILIIDEGTSNMDRGTEELITELLLKIKNRMGIIMISHKLGMVRSVSDRICVLENHTIKCEGTHKELIAEQNFYSKFWKDFE